MTATSSPTQSEQTPMNAYDTPFKHRISATPSGKFINAFDAIGSSLERAAALSDLLETVFQVADADSFDPDTLWRTAQAISMEIKDAKTILNACMEQEEARKSKPCDPALLNPADRGQSELKDKMTS